MLVFRITFIHRPVIERDRHGEIMDIGGRREGQGVIQHIFEVWFCRVKLAGGCSVAAIWVAKERRVCVDCWCWVVKGEVVMKTVLTGYPCVDAAVGVGV
jgi:hypothetical protein